MATEIELSTDRSLLGRAEKAAQFVVRIDGEKLGELLVSKGAIRWFPANAQKPIRMNWPAFAALMSSKRVKL